MKAVLLHPSAHPVVADVAATPLERHRGLRGRYNLLWNNGMLFVFPDSYIHTFTMEDTPLPLDMLFLDGEGLVLGIIQNAVPFSRGPYNIAMPSKFVLEVNAGWTSFFGVEPGDIFTYTEISEPDRSR